MDVINKLYSSVSSTVSQLSGVLPGNPVTREYEVTGHIASAGPDLLWKVYSGHKKSTREEAAVFVFEKRQLERWPRGERDEALETLRRGVVQLTKLRHPRILTVQHPLEESRESLAFATEPVFASLANVLGRVDNAPSPLPPALASFAFHDVELKYGLLQLGEALAFLHADARLLHRCLCPGAVVLNARGAWKLFGFDVCASLDALSADGEQWPVACRQPTGYAAPECTRQPACTAAADMFALGALACAVHAPDHRPTDAAHVPPGLRECVRQLLSARADQRPDAHRFVRAPHFDDAAVRTLADLDSLLQWDDARRARLYRALPDALARLPPRVALHRALPCLAADLARAPMVPLVLPAALAVAERCTPEDCTKYAMPALAPALRLATANNAHALLAVARAAATLLRLAPAAAASADLLTVIYRGLDADVPRVHELCLEALPVAAGAGLLEHAALRNAVLPRVKRLCLTPPPRAAAAAGDGGLSVRVHCLLCLGRLLAYMDKWLVLDEVVPFLPQVPAREPAVLMGVLGVYKLALDNERLGIAREVLAARVIPHLAPLCVEDGLTVAQFDALVALLRRMFDIVESEQRRRLRELNAARQLEAEAEAAATAPCTAPPPAIATSTAPATTTTPDVSSLSLEDLLMPRTATSASRLPAPPAAAAAMPTPAAAPVLLTPVCAAQVRPAAPPIDLTASLSTGSTWPAVAAAPRAQSPPQLAPAPTLSMAPASTLNMAPSPWASSRPAPAPAADWSSLDKLLPPSVASKKVPMNQMASKQPLLPVLTPAAAPAVNNATPALSPDEIMDLLS